MSSLRRVAASRANGNKSRGPITLEGKRISAQNSTRHGLLAQSIVLTGEDPSRFEALLDELYAEFHPVGPVENALVETLAVSRWRQMRLWALEGAGLNYQIARQEESVDPSTRAALAFRTLSDQSRSLELLNRYESRYDRQFGRTLARLTAFRESTFAKRT